MHPPSASRPHKRFADPRRDLAAHGRWVQGSSFGHPSGYNEADGRALALRARARTSAVARSPLLRRRRRHGYSAVLRANTRLLERVSLYSQKEGRAGSRLCAPYHPKESQLASSHRRIPSTAAHRFGGPRLGTEPAGCRHDATERNKTGVAGRKNSGSIGGYEVSSEGGADRTKQAICAPHVASAKVASGAMVKAPRFADVCRSRRRPRGRVP